MRPFVSVLFEQFLQLILKCGFAWICLLKFVDQRDGYALSTCFANDSKMTAYVLVCFSVCGPRSHDRDCGKEEVLYLAGIIGQQVVV